MVRVQVIGRTGYAIVDLIMSLRLRKRDIAPWKTDGHKPDGQRLTRCPSGYPCV